MPINRPVRAVTQDGTTISGRRLNEDTYTVQLIDDRSGCVSLIKADLASTTIVTTSPMPSYADDADRGRDRRPRRVPADAEGTMTMMTLERRSPGSHRCCRSPRADPLRTRRSTADRLLKRRDASRRTG